MSQIIARPASALPATLDVYVAQAKDFGRAARATATRRAYAADLADFEAFCSTHGVEALPADPQTVATYFTALASTKSVATIRRRAVAIAQAHKEVGLENPVGNVLVRRVLTGIANVKGVAQTKKAALTLDLIKDALLACTGSPKRVARDRALILVAFNGGFRRSELAALNVEDLQFSKAGLVVTLRRSKTDQEGRGRDVELPRLPAVGICPVVALREWLELAGITDGPVFRTFSMAGELQANRIDGRDVARLVKRVVDKASLEGDFSGHSFRAGFITEAKRNRVDNSRIARVTGHKSYTILDGYDRRVHDFENAPQLDMIAKMRT